MSYQMMTKQQQAGSAGVSLKDLQAQVAMLMQQNAALAAMVQERGERKLTLKVSEKGALCVYGLGRWPVTLYASQWEKLLPMADEIKAFIAANADKLTRKEA